MEEVKVIYLGGPTIILEIGGLRIMTDPTLDQSGSTFPVNSDYVIEKLMDPAISEIGVVDLVLLSHDQHGDNLDNAGRALLKKVSKTITTKVGAERLKGTAFGMKPWEQLSIPTPVGFDVIITATPARHGPAGSESVTGEVIGFIISSFNNNIPVIYLTGDTVFFQGVKDVAEKYAPHFIFLYAGAARPRVPFNITMGSNDALDTAFAFSNAVIIPIHYEGWSHFSEGKVVLSEAFQALGIEKRLRFLPPGITTPLIIDNISY